MSEMLSLMQRAKTHVSGDTGSTFTWCYRNKSRQYFSDITSKHGGVMKTYLKDATGDIRSPINGEINGLFFKAGELQHQSPFGDTRFLVRADILLRLAPNVFFADFYCLNGKAKDHYVTLIQTRPGSNADTICQRRLPRLNIHDKNASPFLYYVGENLRVSSKCMVEVFFTEDLEIDQLVANNQALMQYNIPKFGAGKTTQGGRAKHSLCEICRTKRITNLHSSFEEF